MLLNNISGYSQQSPYVDVYDEQSLTALNVCVFEAVK